MNRTFTEKLKERLNQPLPGKDAQNKMAPSFRFQIPEKIAINNAGVMLLIYPFENSYATVFMKRTEYPGVHSGQVSFPGGKADQSDSSIKQTALRETKEEFGIPETDIEILGKLTPLHIPVSSFDIYPFVGLLKKRPQFNIDPNEVEYLIEINLDLFLTDKISKVELQTHGKYTGNVPYYLVNNDKIWGATAMVLSEFIEIYKIAITC
jgi:8-oxo-dGTP pyrophosphatase MutT (NUDIX family)